MDRSTRRLDQSESESTSAPTLDKCVDILAALKAAINASPARSPARSIRVNSFPMGTPQRHPPSPFPPETGKGTLETGPSYER